MIKSQKENRLSAVILERASQFLGFQSLPVSFVAVGEWTALSPTLCLPVIDKKPTLADCTYIIPLHPFLVKVHPEIGSGDTSILSIAISLYLCS